MRQNGSHEYETQLRSPLQSSKPQTETNLKFHENTISSADENHKPCYAEPLHEDYEYESCFFVKELPSFGMPTHNFTIL